MSFKGVWRESLDMMAQVFKRSWAWLVFSQGIEVLSSLGASTIQRWAESYLIVAIVFMFISQLILMVLGFVIINQIVDDVRAKRKTFMSEALTENLKYVFIEWCRALLRILVFGILFVIPGIYQWIRLMFVPFVAQFDGEYKKGRVDALEKSRQLVQGRFWRVAGILLLTLVLSILPSFWLGSVKVFEKPFEFTMLFFVSMVLELYSSIVVYCTYRRLEGPESREARGGDRGDPIQS